MCHGNGEILITIDFCVWFNFFFGFSSYVTEDIFSVIKPRHCEMLS